MKKRKEIEPVNLRADLSLTGTDPKVIRDRIKKFQDPMYQWLLRHHGCWVETTQMTMNIPEGAKGVLVDFAGPDDIAWQAAGNAVIAVPGNQLFDTPNGVMVIKGFKPEGAVEWWGRQIEVSPDKLPGRLFVNRVHLRLTAEP